MGFGSRVWSFGFRVWSSETDKAIGEILKHPGSGVVMMQES